MAKSGGYMQQATLPAHVIKALQVLSDFSRAHKAGGGALPGDVAGASVLGQGDFPGTDFSNPVPVATPASLPTPAATATPSTPSVTMVPINPAVDQNEGMTAGRNETPLPALTDRMVPSTSQFADPALAARQSQIPRLG
jgi:hypothetical protein